MDRGSWRVLLCLGLVLVLFPLTLAKPGLPTSLKADEAAYYLMALSLSHDRDLRLEVADVDRAFVEFPFRPVSNLIAMTDDGWRTVYFGKPYVYSMLGAPFARLWGANGLVALNMLLLVAMIAMGASHLGRHNPAGTALLFAAGFFLLSTAFAYAFWIQPEIFNMAGVTACLYFGFGALERGDGSARRRLSPALAALLSAGALALTAYNKPVYALLGLPVLAAYLWGRQWRLVLAWLAGLVGASAVLVGVALALTGHASSYLGVVRQGVTLCEPGRMPIGPTPAAATTILPPAAVQPSTPGDSENAPSVEAEPLAPIPAVAPTRTNAWAWIFRVPPITFGQFLENLRYFFLGRHTGLVLYLPFALVATLLFVAGEHRRSRRRWLLLASIAAVALFFLTAIFFNWHGGGGFVGNRYFAAAYPGFLFLVSRIRWQAAVAAGFAWGGICLGPLLFTPFGAPIPEPTLQAHVRNWPYPLFPLELSLRNVPGYDRLALGDVRLTGRRDVLVPRGNSVWLRGGDEVEVWMQSERPIAEAVFELESGAPENLVRLRLEGAAAEHRFAAAGERARLTLRPEGPGQVRTQRDSQFFVYRLRVASEQARIATYTRERPPNNCPYFPEKPTSEELFPLGVALTYLGDRDPDGRELYALSWGPPPAPLRLRAGEQTMIPVQLWNRSEEPWTPHGAARVRLAYHWLRADGSVAVRDGERTELPREVEPGGELRVEQRVVAPAEPGSYVLELDPVYEGVAWFSERNGGITARVPVEVVAP